jgi:hypothetical protein
LVVDAIVGGVVSWAAAGVDRNAIDGSASKHTSIRSHRLPARVLFNDGMKRPRYT